MRHSATDYQPRSRPRVPNATVSATPEEAKVPTTRRYACGSRKNPRRVRRAYADFDTDTEVILDSADRVDVVYYGPTSTVVVEVKSLDSDDTDLRRGVFQCIKYRAVMAVMEAMDMRSETQVVPVLVTQAPLPGDLGDLVRRHGIRHFKGADAARLAREYGSAPRAVVPDPLARIAAPGHTVPSLGLRNRIREHRDDAVGHRRRIAQAITELDDMLETHVLRRHGAERPERCVCRWRARVRRARMPPVATRSAVQCARRERGGDRRPRSEQEGLPGTGRVVPGRQVDGVDRSSHVRVSSLDIAV